jgi:AcrR family transcriptional regulator
MRRRTGRRPGDTQTRDAILDAARRHFADHGYRGATMRGIARDAGVDPALIHHFFGRKIDLFRATIDAILAPTELVPRLLRNRHGGADPSAGGAAFMLRRWQDPEQRLQLLAMLRAAATDDEAAAILRDVVHRDVIGAVPQAGEGDDTRVGIGLLGSHVLGLALLRNIVQLPVLIAEDIERLAAILERAHPMDRVLPRGTRVGGLEPAAATHAESA